MQMKRGGIVVACILSLCVCVAVLLLTNKNFRPAGVMTLGEVQGTPYQVYLPSVAQGDKQATPSATADNVLLTPGQPASTPESSDIEPQGTPPPEPFKVTPYIPAPLPDLKATSIPELDKIAFTNLRQLNLTSEQQNSFAFVAWSPDSKYFTGFTTGKTKLTTSEEVDAPNLYLGNTETGELSLWNTDGVWSSWSRDGKSIYYLSPRRNGKDFVTDHAGNVIYDLYRRSVDATNTELVMQDTSPPYVQQLPSVETSKGSLLTLNRMHQPVVVSWAANVAEMKTLAQQQPTIVSLSTLIGRSEQPQMSDDSNKTFYNVAPDGNQVAVIPMGQQLFHIVDLSKHSVIAEIDGVPNYANNVAWAPDSRSLAYTTQEGVYLLDVTTHQQLALITRKDLGFKEGYTWSDFVSPQWIANGKIVLFSPRSPDWVTQGQEDHTRYISFVATSDGRHWKALSLYRAESVSPNGRYVIIVERDPKSGNETKYLAEIIS